MNNSIVLLIGLLFCGIVNAQQFMDIYVGVEYSQDNNFFKVSGPEEAIAITGSSEKNEELTQLYAGVNGEAPLSRQSLEYALRVNNNNYDRFEALDNTGYEANINLAWVAGSTLSGDVGIRHQKFLNQFSELQELVKDMETNQDIYFDGNYHFHPDWYFVGALSRLWVDHSERPELERKENNARIEVLYVTSANTRFGLSNSYSRGTYTNRQDVDGESIDNSYKGVNYSAVAYWEGTAKSTLSARAGVTERQHDELPGRDFDGFAWLLEYNWKATAKTELDVSVWRDIRDDPDIIGYIDESGMALSPSVQITPKLSLRITLKTIDKKYDGDATTELEEGRIRKDDFNQVRVNLVFKALRSLRTYLRYINSDRDSNENSSDYTTDIWRIGAELVF